MALPSGITASWLKTNYGAGLTFVDRSGVPIPASVFDVQLCAAQEWVEYELGVIVGPRVIEADRYDVTRNMSGPYFQARVRNRPVRTATGARFRWGNSVQAQALPVGWLVVRNNRLIEIVPNPNNPFIPNPGVVWTWNWPFPNTTGRYPGFLELDYTAGFDGIELAVPSGISNAIGLKAAQLLFAFLSNSLFPPGTTNISRSQDGISQSRGSTASTQKLLLGNLIDEYQRQLDIQMQTLRAQWGASSKFLTV